MTGQRRVSVLAVIYEAHIGGWGGRNFGNQRHSRFIDAFAARKPEGVLETLCRIAHPKTTIALWAMEGRQRVPRA